MAGRSTTNWGGWKGMCGAVLKVGGGEETVEEGRKRARRRRSGGTSSRYAATAPDTRLTCRRGAE